MANKLKDLKITKVDFVDAGANPNANIKLYKNKDGKPASENPTTQVESIEPEPAEPKSEGMWKRFISAIGKAVGLKPDEIDATVEEIAKGNEAVTFSEKMYEVTRRKITDEIWDMCYALQCSLCSIICDEEVSNAQGLMETSLEEFKNAMAEAIVQWSEGKTLSVVKKSIPVTAEDIKVAKAAIERLECIIEKGEPKGELTEMKIDKSKMTAVEKAFYEDIEKRYGDGSSEPEGATTEPSGVVTKAAAEPVTEPVVPEADDIYKGLHPAVAEELKALRKRADEAEEKELAEIAKKYEIIGKKPEELVPVLKSLKAAGGSAYAEMVNILDASVEAVNKSSMFTEIGKSGGTGAGADVLTRIEKKAAEILQAEPTLNRYAAIDKVCQLDPQLAREYEELGRN